MAIAATRSKSPHLAADAKGRWPAFCRRPEKLSRKTLLKSKPKQVIRNTEKIVISAGDGARCS